MLIISKYKDYYDYLTGIYGIDEKLVLDRRNYSNMIFPPDYLRFYIAGYIVEGIFHDNFFWYGDNLDTLKIRDRTRRYWLSKHDNRDYDKSIEVVYGKCENWIYKEPMLDKDEINNRFDCPILMDLHPTWREKDVAEYPLLKDFNLAKFVPAETIYQWLSEWLGNRITAKEQSPELSNEGKVEAKGFDKKRSFRTKMK